jgi:hypothetical protein
LTTLELKAKVRNLRGEGGNEGDNIGRRRDSSSSSRGKVGIADGCWRSENVAEGSQISQHGSVVMYGGVGVDIGVLLELVREVRLRADSIGEVTATAVIIDWCAVGSEDLMDLGPSGNVYVKGRSDIVGCQLLLKVLDIDSPQGAVLSSTVVKDINDAYIGKTRSSVGEGSTDSGPNSKADPFLEGSDCRAFDIGLSDVLGVEKHVCATRRLSWANNDG